VIEIFCLEPEDEVSRALMSSGEVLWRCLVGGLKKWKQQTLFLDAGAMRLAAEIKEKRNEDVLIRFWWEPAEKTFSEVLATCGVMPVPPYLNRETEEIDRSRYQTVYAGDQGSVAAPTAGLHFTPAVLQKLKDTGMSLVNLTLHVGSGTFKPVKADRLGGHSMHAEWISVSRPALLSIIDALKKGAPVIAVGTTSLRTIESLYWLGVKLHTRPGDFDLHVHQWDPYGELAVPDISAYEAFSAVALYMDVRALSTLSCRTSLLIAPPCKLKVANGLITNFHQPRSTLLLLVSAVTGSEWKKIYRHAMDHGYRFLSYGDSSLLLT
jgi:S-adenosylmethionine:tRNA ribosyltransferase-isomerase